MKKKNLVVVIFIIGLILIVISTINFLYKIPKLDKEISETDEQVKIRWDAYSKFQINEASGLDTYHQLKILSEINPKSSEINNLERDMLILKRQSLIYLSQFVQGTMADEKLTERWAGMNFDELEKEKIAFAESSANFQDILGKLNKLKSDKQTVQFWSAIFQILGLVINQLAILLHIKWFSQE